MPGNTRRPTGVAARKLAREKMATVLEAQRKRDEQNVTDLETFYTQAKKIDAAAAKRDAVITAAHATYTDAVRNALDTQGTALRAIRARGTSQSDLRDMTGLPAGELRKLLKRPASKIDTDSGGCRISATNTAAAHRHNSPGARSARD